MSLQPTLLRVLQENKIRRVGGTQQIPIDLASEGSTDLGPSMLPFPIRATLKEIEKSAILVTVTREDGNQSKTAAVLGISRPTLRAKLHAYNG